MGIALLASSMIFVSCKKDNTTDEPTQTIPDGVNITINGQDFMNNSNAADLSCSCLPDGTFGLFAFGSEEEYVPGFEAIIRHKEVGTFEEDIIYNNPQEEMPHFASGDAFYAFIDAYLYDGNNAVYGDWWAKKHKTNIAKLDLTGLKVSFTTEGTLFDANAALVEGTGIAGASTQPFAISAGNVSMEMANN